MAVLQSTYIVPHVIFLEDEKLVTLEARISNEMLKEKVNYSGKAMKLS